MEKSSSLFCYALQPESKQPKIADTEKSPYNQDIMHLTYSDTLIILQLLYFGLVWSAVGVFFARPLVEFTFAKWLPVTYPVPSRQMYLIRVMAISVLAASTFWLPAMNITTGQDHYHYTIVWAEFFMLLLVGLTTFYISITTVKKLFDMIGYWVENHLPSDAPLPETPRKMGQSFHVRNALLLFILLVICIAGLRFFVDAENLVFQDLIDIFTTITSPHPYDKHDWLNIAYIGVLIVLTYLIHRAFAALPKLANNEWIDTPAPSYAIRSLYLVLSIAIIVIGFSIPI
ncbi:MAG: hypothetical protein OQK24_05825 [Magnetovibrio sp.]|nr:hypothetical protein [Magnetovibrio sp.]